MISHRVNFIKSNKFWFADFTETELTPNINGVNQRKLLPLTRNGWDEWVEIVSEGDDNFWMTLSNYEIEGGTELKYLNLTETSPNPSQCGNCYEFKSYKGIEYNIKFWVCSNGLDFVFGETPSSWFFKKEN